MLPNKKRLHKNSIMIDANINNSISQSNGLLQAEI